MFLLWVISPSQMTEQIFSDFGLRMLDSELTVSVGLITGGTVDSARALWQRKIQTHDRFVSVVPAGAADRGMDQRPGGRPTVEQGEPHRRPARQSGYLTYQGHGTPRLWLLDETMELTARDLPDLPPLFVDALACQTLKIQRDESIALSFIDHGAAGYAGFVHSPLGYTVSEAKGFPFGRTLAGLPRSGTSCKLQNRALLQGSIAWPYYFLLGRSAPVVPVGGAVTRWSRTAKEGHVRTLRYAGAAAGHPARARSQRRRVCGRRGSGGGQGLGAGAVLQQRRPNDRRRSGQVPAPQPTGRRFHRQALSPDAGAVVGAGGPLVTALDYTTTVCHLEGSVPVELVISGLLGVVIGVFWVRRKVHVRDAWPGALLVGAALLAWRGRIRPAALRRAVPVVRQPAAHDRRRVRRQSPVPGGHLLARGRRRPAVLRRPISGGGER